MDQAANTPGFQPLVSMPDDLKRRVIANRRALRLPLYAWMLPLVHRTTPRPVRAVFVSTGGKSKAEIVRDVARAMRRAGLLKETPRKSR